MQCFHQAAPRFFHNCEQEMSATVAGGRHIRFAPLPARLCIDTETKRVRRYVRNPYGKVWATHEAVLQAQNDDIFERLEEFRLNRELPVEAID